MQLLEHLNWDCCKHITSKWPIYKWRAD